MIDYLRNGDSKGAIAYKNEEIPRSLYKYYLLFDSRFVHFEEENQKRLRLLESGEFWLSSYFNLNGPYELKALMYDESQLAPAGTDLQRLHSLVEEQQSRYGIGSFSTNFSRNMPMWAHYANNHNGYCIEYEVTDPRYVFKVLYEKSRHQTKQLPRDVFEEVKIAMRDGKRPSARTESILLLLFLSNFVKHDVWSYEDEYRILYNFRKRIGIGRSITAPKLGIQPKRIYLGLAISEQHRTELLAIGRTIDCEVWQMVFDDSNAQFELKADRLL
ncbi:DUF2971 domain-containing protein [Sporosarcina sp. Te-1]|uniref:DUF2971 domain-containing protein n=1 Tax=Sporosarcina sp. Te-1 TaxID=2818390 RepID=UPI001A9F3B5F|nr:DUF2971 domain-containing protein [Sporosarcina sp. Te-1]QTD40917.1 DUF2971 domain-containing protein [Sporosarcina sp. Te-1]